MGEAEGGESGDSRVTATVGMDRTKGVSSPSFRARALPGFFLLEAAPFTVVGVVVEIALFVVEEAEETGGVVCTVSLSSGDTTALPLDFATLADRLETARPEALAADFWPSSEKP